MGRLERMSTLMSAGRWEKMRRERSARDRCWRKTLRGNQSPETTNLHKPGPARRHPRHHQVSLISSLPGSLTPTDRNFEGSLMADDLAHPYGRRKSCCTLVLSPNDCWLIRWDVGKVVTIDDLSDDDLLVIFDFCVVRLQDLGLFHESILFAEQETIRKIDSWQSLVHVCRRWRDLVFKSPRRLNLQLLCIPGTSARRSLDVWPALPLLIRDHGSEA